MVNNAGYAPQRRLLKVEEATFDLITAINWHEGDLSFDVGGRCRSWNGRAAARSSPRHRPPACVPRPGLTWYNASKAGRSPRPNRWRWNWRRRKSRVNCPPARWRGETGMLAQFMGGHAGARAQFKAVIPLGRFSTTARHRQCCRCGWPSMRRSSSPALRWRSMAALRVSVIQPQILSFVFLLPERGADRSPSADFARRQGCAEVEGLGARSMIVEVLQPRGTLPPRAAFGRLPPTTARKGARCGSTNQSRACPQRLGAKPRIGKRHQRAEGRAGATSVDGAIRRPARTDARIDLGAPASGPGSLGAVARSRR